MGVFRSGRGGPTRNELVVRGLMLLSVGVALVLVMSLSLSGAFADTSQVTSRLRTAGGSITSGSDVKMGGLIVGRVDSVSGDAQGVELALDMDNKFIDGIPSDVKARVLPATVFGTSYVDLAGGGPVESGRSLRAGDVIAQDLSVPTLELQKALDSIDQLVEALGPAELNTALTAVATALDGQGANLGRTLETADRLLSKVSPEMPLIREDLRLLAVNLETIADVAPDLLDAVDDALFVGAHLVERRADLTKLLAGGTNLVRDGNRFLTANEDDLVRLVRTAAIVSGSFYAERQGLRRGLLAVNNLTGRIQTLGSGGALEVKGRLVDPSRYSYYTRADCPRYGRAEGGNCGGGAGRAGVGELVGGSLTGGDR